MEVADREEATAGARAFQKLIYVSSQVFGEVRSGFLTPWVSRFGVSPEQVLVAKRDAGAVSTSGKLWGALGAAEFLRMCYDRPVTVGMWIQGVGRKWGCVCRCRGTAFHRCCGVEHDACMQGLRCSSRACSGTLTVWSPIAILACVLCVLRSRS